MNISKSLSTIRLEQYQKIINLEDQDEKRIVKILLEIPDETLDYIRRKDFVKLKNDWDEFLEDSHPFTQTFKLNGIHYGFITNLSELDGNEFKALNSIGRSWDQMHKAMAILYRPISIKIGKHYRIEDFNPEKVNYNTIRSMPLTIVLGAIQFLNNVLNDTIEVTGKEVERKALDILNNVKTA